MSVINMDCRLGMSTLPANSFDAIVTDPPYGLSKQPNMREVLKHWLAGDDYTHTGGGFMGNSWDSFVPGPLTWGQAYRVLKPGGYCAVFAGSRTVDLMATSLRLAGFEVVDMLHWMYGSGFPKSMDISKAIDKAAGAEREVISERPAYGIGGNVCLSGHAKGATAKVTLPATAAARKWDGWGTALKPCHEPIILCRKPLDGTYASNVLTHGCGALNIDACRVPWRDEADEKNAKAKNQHGDFGSGPMTNNVFGEYKSDRTNYDAPGRWPGNVLHDGCLPEPMDRYFYCAKASKADRNSGLDDFETHSAGEMTGGRAGGSAGLNSPRSGAGRTSGSKNVHPTVKPTDLMRWLCRLVTPPGGTILDPFTGSGSTGRGAVLEGFNFVGFELSAEYAAIAQARIEHAKSIHNDL